MPALTVLLKPLLRVQRTVRLHGLGHVRAGIIVVLPSAFGIERIGPENLAVDRRERVQYAVMHDEHQMPRRIRRHQIALGMAFGPPERNEPFHLVGGGFGDAQVLIAVEKPQPAVLEIRQAVRRILQVVFLVAVGVVRSRAKLFDLGIAPGDGLVRGRTVFSVGLQFFEEHLGQFSIFKPDLWKAFFEALIIIVGIAGETLIAEQPGQARQSHRRDAVVGIPAELEQLVFRPGHVARHGKLFHQSLPDTRGPWMKTEQQQKPFGLKGALGFGGLGGGGDSFIQPRPIVARHVSPQLLQPARQPAFQAQPHAGVIVPGDFLAAFAVGQFQILIEG